MIKKNYKNLNDIFLLLLNKIEIFLIGYNS